MPRYGYLGSLLEKVIQLARLGREIELVVRIAAFLQGNPLRHRNAKALHRLHLAWIIGHQAQAGDVQRLEHIGTDGVVAHVGSKAQRHIGFDGIGALILQMIGRILLSRPMPRPSWRTYNKTPRPALAMFSMAACNWKPQSQRRLNKASPVRHSE